MNIKTALILGALATLSPVSEASQCDPDLKKLESAFEVFFPGKGASYTKDFYLASEIKEELKKLFKVCAVKNHPGISTGQAPWYHIDLKVEYKLRLPHVFLPLMLYVPFENFFIESNS